MDVSSPRLRAAPNERVVEIPWALGELPQSGLVLDVGSCDATYLLAIHSGPRRLECLDPRDCRASIPDEIAFHQEPIFGNSLPRGRYDAVLMVSVLEHLGLPTYGQPPLRNGDVRALAECWRLLKGGGRLIATFPAGRPRVLSWYRQYSPKMIAALFAGWIHDVRYWGYTQDGYVEITEDDASAYSYRDRFDGSGGAGALAGVVAVRS